MKSGLRRLAVWSWYLAALVLVLSASLVSLGQYYFPYLGEYREPLLRRAAAELPFGIEITGLNAEWTGLAPTFHVQGLRLYARNEPAVTILSSSRCEIRIDILRSLFSLAPRLRKIVAENVALEFLEMADGSWRMAGVGDSRSRSNPEEIIAFFLAIEEIELHQTRLLLKARSGAPIETRGALLLMENYRRFRRLQISAREDASDGDLNVLLEAHGDPRKSGDFDAAAYIDLHNIQLARFQPLLGARLKLPDAGLNGKIWARMEAGGRLSWQGDLKAAKVELTGPWKGRQLAAVHNLELRAAGEWAAGRGTLWVDRLALEWYGESLALERLRLDVSGDAQARNVEIGADYLDLGAVAGVLHSSALLTGPWGDALAELAPYGGLADARMSLALRPSAPADFRLRARMIDVSVSPWKHAPGVRNAEGYLEVTPGGGHAEIASGAISLEFPRIYDHDLAFDSISGRVSWLRDADGVRVGSELLRLVDGETELGARFDLEFHRDPQLDDQISLAVGLRHAQASARAKYIPYLVDSGLRDWLDANIQGGRVDVGALAYHAIFARPEHAASSKLQLGLDVRDAALSFHPEWPPVSGVDGRFVLDGARVEVRAHAGRMLQSDIGQAEVEITPASDGKRLRVHGRLSGDLADGLRVINESPLAAVTGGALRSWTAHGDLGVALDLDMPLGGSLDPEKSRLRVSADIAGAEVYLGDQDLPIETARGHIVYDLASGLSSDSLTGKLWGLPLRAAISEREPGSRLMAINVLGSAHPQRVAQWLGVDPAGYLSGTSAFRLRIEQQPEGGMRSVLDSDLVGAGSSLPAPLGKSAEAALALHVESLPLAAGNEIHITLDQLLQSALLRDRNGSWSGEVILGAEAHGGGQGLRVSGALEDADAGGWIQASQRLLSANPRGDMSSDHGLRFDGLQFRSASLLSATLHGLRLDSRREQQDFVLAFTSDLLAGEFRVPGDHALPYGLKLSDIQLQPFMASTDGSDRRKRADAWSALHGVQVPAIDVEVAQATLGEQDVGTWSFRVESEEDAMALDDVRASLPGMRVRGQGKAPGGSLRLRWVEGQPRTELVAGLKTRDIGKFFESWGYSRLVESHKGNTDIALEWPGYPTDFDMAEVSGLVDFTWKDGNLTREGSNNPIMRALGVLNFNEALRRIKFDFKDLYQEGLSFDRFEAAIDLERGLARTREPVELQGASARIRLSGQSDLRARTIDADLIVTLPIGSNLPWVAALAGGLPAAAGVYVASRLFENQLGKFSSAVYKVSGAIDDPQLEFVKVFDVTEAVKQGEPKPREAAPESPPGESVAGTEAPPAPAAAPSAESAAIEAAAKDSAPSPAVDPAQDAVPRVVPETGHE